MAWGRFKGTGRAIAPQGPQINLVARLSTCVWSSTRVLVAWSHLGYTSIPFTSPKVPLWYGWCQILGAIKLGPGQLLYPYIRNGKVAAYVYNRGDGVCETDDVACAIFAFMDTLSPQTNVTGNPQHRKLSASEGAVRALIDKPEYKSSLPCCTSKRVTVFQ